MAISWGEGLLAGAAGVAEYSKQEKDRRQKRIDRTLELKNKMRSHQAKSKYAVKMNDYEKNKALMVQLESAGEDIYAQQYAIGKAAGLDDKTANFRANQATQGTVSKLPTPEAQKLPSLNMPSVLEGQASSPIQDWMRKYMEPTRERVKESPKTQVEGEVEPIAPGTLGNDGTLGSGTTLGTGETLGTEGTVVEEPQGTEEFKQFQLPEATSKALPPSWHSVRIDDVDSNTGKKTVTIKHTDRNNPGVSNTETVTLNTSGVTRLDNRKHTAANGLTTATIQKWNPVTSEVENGPTYVTNEANPMEPVELVKLDTVEDFMHKGNEDTGKPAGSFYSTFPEEERNKWKKRDTGPDWFDIAGNDIPEGFENAIGKGYLSAQKGLVDAKWIDTNKVNNPNVMAQVDQIAKASAYLNLLGEDGVVDWVNSGAIDAELFYGEAINTLPVFQAVHNKLGISEDSKGKQYKDFVKFSATNYNF